MSQRVKPAKPVSLAVVTLALATVGTIVGFVPRAHAATFAQTELSYDGALLSQFNLISLGNLNVGTTNGAQVYAGGRVIAGSVTTGANGFGACVGSIVPGNNACTGNAPSIGSGNTTATGAATLSGTGYGALTVFGNVAGYVGASGGGTQFVGGNVGGNSAATLLSSGRNGVIDGGSTTPGAVATGINVAGTLGLTTTAQNSPKYTTQQSALTRGGTVSNVGTTSYSQTLATVFPFGSESANITTPLKNLYSGLANLPGSPNVTAQPLLPGQTGVLTSNTAYTTVVNGTTYKYGVVTTTLANLFQQGSSFTGIANGAGNSATFVIVTGDGATNLLPTLTNNDSKVIYDFVGASSLALAGTFNASILAPLANLNAGSNSINGTVVVASMTANNNLYNGNVFTGDLTGLTNFGYNARVPEPLSLSLFGVGVAAAVFARRPRK